MKKLKVIGWNINQRSGYNSLGTVPHLVISEIQKKKADLIVLTEYVKQSDHLEFTQSLKELGYAVFYNANLNRKTNEVLIAIKKNLISDKNTVQVVNEITSPIETPNFLQVSFQVNNEIINIIGTRIRIGFTFPVTDQSLIDDAKERNEQVISLVSYIKDLDGQTFVVGDFNNYYYDDESSVTSWKDDKRWLQNYHSYPLIVKQMLGCGFKPYTPQGRCFSWEQKRIPQSNPKRFIKNDHIFSNGAVFNESYYWGFVETDGYVFNRVGYPDHAMITAEIKI